MNEHFYSGFIKRAQDYGLSAVEAHRLIKAADETGLNLPSIGNPTHIPLKPNELPTATIPSLPPRNRPIVFDPGNGGGYGAKPVSTDDYNVPSSLAGNLGEIRPINVGNKQYDFVQADDYRLPSPPGPKELEHTRRLVEKMKSKPDSFNGSFAFNTPESRQQFIEENNNLGPSIDTRIKDLHSENNMLADSQRAMASPGNFFRAAGSKLGIPNSHTEGYKTWQDSIKEREQGIHKDIYGAYPLEANVDTHRRNGLMAELYHPGQYTERHGRDHRLHSDAGVRKGFGGFMARKVFEPVYNNTIGRLEGSPQQTPPWPQGLKENAPHVPVNYAPSGD